MGRARARTSHDREVVDGAKGGRFAANVLPVGRTLVRIGWLLLALAGGTRAAAAGLAASEVEFARPPAGLDRAVAEQAWLEGEGARLEAGGALPVRRAGAERGHDCPKSNGGRQNAEKFHGSVIGHWTLFIGHFA